MTGSRRETTVPLCVDCDGTLLRTDLLLESLLALLKQSPLSLLLVPFWFAKGKAYLKQRIVERVDLDVTLLPYNIPLLTFLRQEESVGRKLVLVTASPRQVAEKIAEHLKLFRLVMGSDEAINLKGKCKSDSLVRAFGDRGFEYAGNARVDLEVWRCSRAAILVNASRSVEARAVKLTEIAGVFQNRSLTLRSYLRALRLHQWLKNLLVFVPLFAGHLADDVGLVKNATIGFLAFGFTASSAYILNDLLDLFSDRGHPRKRFRPFASGDIPLTHGIVLIPCLLAAAVTLSLLLPLRFGLMLAVYYLATVGYSLWIKNEVVLDVIVLACLYSCRVLAGAAATEIAPFFSLLAFTVFIFLSLALIKRYSELQVMLRDGKKSAKGRGYYVDDLPFLESLGTASGAIAVLVLALYINSVDVLRHYSQPEWLWLLCPLLLYWIGYTWMKTHRGEMNDDPLLFATQNRLSQMLAVFALVVWSLATWGIAMPL